MSFANAGLDHDPNPAPRVRFSSIGDGWELFKRAPITWSVTVVFVAVCNGIASGIVYRYFGGPELDGLGGVRGLLPPIGLTIGTFVSAAFNGLFLGGMFRMACLQIRGESIRFSDFFSVSDVFFELVTGAVLTTLICLIGGMFCLIPGLVASGLLMFTLPLIVDGRFTALQALQKSYEVLKGEWLMATIFHVAVYALTGLGVCFFVIGLLFTMPLYTLSIAILYRDFLMVKGPGISTEKSPDPYF